MTFIDNATGEVIGTMDLGFLVLPMIAAGIVIIGAVYFAGAADVAKEHDSKWVVQHIWVPFFGMLALTLTLLTINFFMGSSADESQQIGNVVESYYLLFMLGFTHVLIGYKTQQRLSFHPGKSRPQNLTNERAKHARPVSEKDQLDPMS